MDDPRQTAIDFYKSKGLTDEQSRGLVRRLHVESGLNPSAYNPAGGGYGAYGAAQWRGPRLVALLKRPDAHTLQGQLEYSWEELTGPEKKSLEAIKNAKTEQQAYNAATDYYERPGTSGASSGGHSSLWASLSNYGFTLPSAEGGDSGGDPYAALLAAPDPFAVRRPSALSSTTSPSESSFMAATQQPIEPPAPNPTPPTVAQQPTMPRIGALSNAYQRALATILSRMQA